MAPSPPQSTERKRLVEVMDQGEPEDVQELARSAVREVPEHSVASTSSPPPSPTSSQAAVMAGEERHDPDNVTQSQQLSASAHTGVGIGADDDVEHDIFQPVA